MLFNQYTALIETHNKEVFFDININIEDLSKSEIWLKSNDEKIDLDNWSITDRN